MSARISSVLIAIRENLQQVERLIAYEKFDESRELLQQSLTYLERIKSVITEIKYTIVKNAIDALDNICTASININVNNTSYTAETIKTGIGRPSILITREQLLFLFSHGYSAKAMARSFSCSISTVYKRCYEESIKFRDRYSSIDDEHLINKIKEINAKFPNSGSVMMNGYLQNEGIYVQRHRIRNILSSIDPVGTANRWSRSIRRRTYKVPTPNSLWHIDAHLKLARWGFVTHGCIDGYSRVIMYLCCTTSITAHTVINLFVPAINKYGIPWRVFKHIYILFNRMN